VAEFSLSRNTWWSLRRDHRPARLMSSTRRVGHHVRREFAREFRQSRLLGSATGAEGLDRHEAIHAIGSVLMGHVYNLVRGDAKPGDPNPPYFQALQRLTASSWQEEFDTTRKRIPPEPNCPSR
jgi:hypothetical protein